MEYMAENSGVSTNTTLNVRLVFEKGMRNGREW